MSTQNVSLSKWVLSFICTYALTDLVFVVLAGLAFRLTARNLVLLFVLTTLSGLITSVLIYWARKALYKPKIFALRFSLSMFVGACLFMSALLFVAANSGIIPKVVMFPMFISIVCPGSIVAGIGMYVFLRVTRKTVPHEVSRDEFK